MTLDIPTLMVMQSFAFAAGGIMLIFAWMQNRAVPALAVWALASFLGAAGILSLMFGVTLRAPAFSAGGGVLLCTQSALMWKAARTIDGRPAAWPLVFVGAAAIIGAGATPLLRDFAQSVGLGSAASYAAVAALSVWAGRGDRLAARWPLVGFMGVHSLSLLFGCVATLTGYAGQDAVPPLMSPFGFIYFESIIFTLGSAVFAVVWIKERNEAATLALARTDGLTGIANRAHFLEAAERALKRCSRDGAPAAVVMFDLDRFKSINDHFGHATGDTVLQRFSEMTCAVLRPQDLFGRLGGEEFALMMPGCGAEAAHARAERIRGQFAENCRFVGGHAIKATVSAGVAASEMSGEPLAELLERADAALYEAKGDGRNRVKRAPYDAAAARTSNVFRVA